MTGLIVNTGSIAAPTLAGACQKATDLAYSIYEAFRGDSRLNGGDVLQCQDFVSPSTGLSFGRTCVPFAQNPLMTDTLHPNAAGQTVKYEMISRAIKANL